MACVVCKKPITVWDKCEIANEFEHLFAQADALGMDSLTEDEQVAVAREVHVGCYDFLP